MSLLINKYLSVLTIASCHGDRKLRISLNTENLTVRYKKASTQLLGVFGWTPSEMRENKISCRNSAKKLQNKTFKDLVWGCIQLVECLPVIHKVLF